MLAPGANQSRNLVLVVALTFLTYAYFGGPAAWNENSRFDLTRAIVERGDLDIDYLAANTGDKAFHDKHYYTDKAPGVSLLGVPAYWLYWSYLGVAKKAPPKQRVALSPWRLTVNQAFRSGEYLTTVFSVGVAGVLFVLCFYRLACRLAVDRNAALLATTSAAFGSLLFPYFVLLYGHAVAGGFLFMAFAILFELRDGRAHPRRRQAVAGLLCGLAVLVEYTAAPAILAVCVYAWLSSRSWRTLGARRRRSGAGHRPGAYNLACFQSPVVTGYQNVADPGFAQGMSTGLMGLTYPDPLVVLELLGGTWRGFLWITPIVFVGIFGLYRFYRDGYRREAWLAGAIALYFLLLTSSYFMWWGGSAAGPRHAVPMLPFILLPLCRLRPGWERRIAWVFAAYSIATMVAAVSVGPETPLVRTPAVRFFWSNFVAGRIAYNTGSTNLGLVLGLPRLWSLTPLLALWLAGAGWVWIQTAWRRSAAREARGAA